MKFFKAVISFIQVLIFSVGLIPVKTETDYGGIPYEPPTVTSPMYIVKDGETDFVVVTQPDSDECIRTAAGELCTYVEKISKARLSCIQTDTVSRDAKVIIIGDGEFTEKLTGKDFPKVKKDGFNLYSDGTKLVISGYDSRGVLYGVYTFLEEYLGVRWFTPELERVPENKDIVIDANIERKEEPSFEIRRNDCAKTNDAHRARTKMNVSFWSEATEYGGALTYVLWDVTLDRLVPDSLFSEHPEYFAMNPDGTRTTDHVCLSNPDVLPIAIENAREAIKNCKNNAKHIHIGQKDNSNYCFCENCTKLYNEYGAISAPTIIFTNRFADALDEEFPDFTFTFYAYGETDRPPTKGSLRCNENVVPVLCELHRACRSHKLTECGAVDGQETFDNLYGENEPMVAEDFKEWTKIADRTYIYDYTINFLNTAQFFSNFETMQSTMKYMEDIGITGYVYNCGDGHEAAFNELRNYILCKLQWNTQCDVRYHMMDFMKEYYGEEAASYIMEILDIQTSQIRATAHAFDFDWHYQSGFYPLYTVKKLDKLWEKALGADADERQHFNVEIANLSWEYFKANQFIGKYSFLNPLRMKANEELYDSFLEHGINRVSSFALIPKDKSEVDFIKRPFTWG